RAALSSEVELFGMKPDTVAARFLPSAEVHSVTVVVLDAGNFFGFQNSNLQGGETFEKARARFDTEFTSRKQRLQDGLRKMGVQPQGEVHLGERSGLKLRAQLWMGAGGIARVLSEEHQLLQVDFFRSEAEARSLLARPGASPSAEKTSALGGMTPRPPAESQPEHRIPGVPMLPQGNRGYCGVAILAMIAHHFGLTCGAEELAVVNGFSYGAESNPDIREMFAQIAREAGVKAQRSPKLDINLLKRTIDSGMPVVVFRRWAQERDYIHSVYSAKIARGEKAELPVASMEDRKSWPGRDAPAHASIINGYRDDRREVIFTESWGPQARNRRMRYEELEGTTYYAVYFSK
ncbi:MAG TPA: C39 family peptidase, partial [Candidatus Saccharimonadia bacterium]|nr:C39 family peptidase [Candidatus Saccharimonadia bacterium]